MRFWEENAVQKVQKKIAKMRLQPFFEARNVQNVQKKKQVHSHIFPALPGRMDLCPGLHWIELWNKIKENKMN